MEEKKMSDMPRSKLRKQNQHYEPEYHGNSWERPLTNEESYLLYYYWLAVAYVLQVFTTLLELLKEKRQLVSIPSELIKRFPRYPEWVWLRQMAKWQNNLFIIAIGVWRFFRRH